MSVEHVLVTGGAGFIGSHTVDRLLTRGCRVTVLDDLSTGDRRNLADALQRPTARLIVGDVAAPLAPLLAPAIDAYGPITRIVHLAAQTSVIKSVERPFEDLRVNLGGTVRVATFAREQAVRSVVFSSSAAVYGDVDDFPIRESHPVGPISPYGVHKLASEHHLRLLARDGVSTTAFRFFNVYGPRQDPKSPYSGVISIFIDRALAGRPLTIFGDGLQTRDFVYVADVVSAVVAALFRADGRGEPVNIGTATETDINTLARLVVAAAGSDSAVRHGPTRAGEILRSTSAIARARDLLGFDPRVPLDVGLRETVSYIRTAGADAPAAASGS